MSDEHQFSTDYQGTTYWGWWRVENGMLTVGSPYGSKCARVHGPTGHEALAKIMLREIVVQQQGDS